LRPALPCGRGERDRAPARAAVHGDRTWHAGKLARDDDRAADEEVRQPRRIYVRRLHRAEVDGKIGHRRMADALEEVAHDLVRRIVETEIRDGAAARARETLEHVAVHRIAD